MKSGLAGTAVGQWRGTNPAGTYASPEPVITDLR